MTRTATRLLAAGTVFAFALCTLQPAMTHASTYGKPALEVTVRVTEKGFLDERGKPFGPKHHLKVPNGQVIKITFVFSEEMNSLAIGDTHQIAMIVDDDETLETEKIWVFHKESSIKFRAGEDGTTKYRAYCIVDCLGMEHLKNLVIKVV